MADNRDLARFEAKVRKAPEGCWEWLAGKKGGGYGAFWFKGRLRGAHRVSLALYRGADIETDLDVMHSCDNPGCVNPEHLSLGTRKDNMMDASRKGRIVRVGDWRGTRNPKAKLTEQQQCAAVRKVVAGASRREVAEQYGVTPERIGQLLKAKKDGGGWAVEEF